MKKFVHCLFLGKHKINWIEDLAAVKTAALEKTTVVERWRQLNPWRKIGGLLRHVWVFSLVEIKEVSESVNYLIQCRDVHFEEGSLESETNSRPSPVLSGVYKSSCVG